MNPIKLLKSLYPSKETKLDFIQLNKILTMGCSARDIVVILENRKKCLSLFRFSCVFFNRNIVKRETSLCRYFRYFARLLEPLSDYTVKGQSYVWRLPQILTPPLSARRVCTPASVCLWCGGEDTLGGEGVGVNILEDARYSSALYIRKYFVVRTFRFKYHIRKPTPLQATGSVVNDELHKMTFLLSSSVNHSNTDSSD